MLVHVRVSGVQQAVSAVGPRLSSTLLLESLTEPGACRVDYWLSSIILLYLEFDENLSV